MTVGHGWKQNLLVRGNERNSIKRKPPDVEQIILANTEESCTVELKLFLQRAVATDLRADK